MPNFIICYDLHTPPGKADHSHRNKIVKDALLNGLVDATELVTGNVPATPENTTDMLPDTTLRASSTSAAELLEAVKSIISNVSIAPSVDVMLKARVKRIYVAAITSDSASIDNEMIEKSKVKIEEQRFRANLAKFKKPRS